MKNCSICLAIVNTFCKFAKMNNTENKPVWSENIILADGDYIDKVAFDLIVNFERMIGRRIPPADMARWMDCVALDGGLREGENAVQTVIVHSKDCSRLDNFRPAHYADELDGKAFKDNLGEFAITAVPVEDIVSAQDLMLDILDAVLESADVKRIMVVPNAERDYDAIRHRLQRLTDDDKRITVFAMQPMQGGNFRQEILGYSLMSALGIRADEIK